MATYILNDDEILVEVTPDPAVVKPISKPPLVTGEIVQLAPYPPIFLYNVGDTIMYLADQAFNFSDIETSTNYAIIKQGAIKTSYVSVPPP